MPSFAVLTGVKAFSCLLPALVSQSLTRSADIRGAIERSEHVKNSFVGAGTCQLVFRLHNSPRWFRRCGHRVQLGQWFREWIHQCFDYAWSATCFGESVQSCIPKHAIVVHRRRRLSDRSVLDADPRDRTWWTTLGISRMKSIFQKNQCTLRRKPLKAIKTGFAAKCASVRAHAKQSRTLGNTSQVCAMHGARLAWSLFTQPCCEYTPSYFKRT